MSETKIDNVIGITYNNTKYCPMCDKDVNKCNFTKHKSRPGGLDAYCKECKNIKKRELRKKQALIRVKIEKPIKTKIEKVKCIKPSYKMKNRIAKLIQDRIFLQLENNKIWNKHTNNDKFEISDTGNIREITTKILINLPDNIKFEENTIKNIAFCGKCDNYKLKIEFTKDNTNKKRVNIYCKKCVSNKTQLKTKAIVNERIKKEYNKDEKWKTIPSFEKYEASTLGRIRNIKTKSILSSSTDMGGYLAMNLYDINGNKINLKVHRIIAETFIPNPEAKLTVNHENKKRTDNRVCNLTWATHQEQIKHMKTFEPPIKKNKIADIPLDDLLNEIWKPVSGFDRYFISNMGRLKYYKYKRNTLKYNKDDKMIITTGVIQSGYLTSTISNGKDNKETFRIHRLVAREFLTNPDMLPFVNHKDGSKTNNKLDNLEYISPSDNTKHAHDTGLYKKGGKRAIYKLDNYYKIDKEYDSILNAKKELKLGNSLTDILKGSKKSCKGFYWCYKENYEKELEKFNKTHLRKINQINFKTGEIINTWDNIIDATKHIGKNYSNTSNIILKNLKNLNKKAYGFRWQYAD
jgi:hypothetical protein